MIASFIFIASVLVLIFIAFCLYGEKEPYVPFAIAMLILLLVISSGCTTRTVEYNGVKYVSKNFLTKQSVGKISIKLGDGATAEVVNFSSDQTQIVEAAVRAGVEAATK